MRLAVVTTHPIQNQAPWLRALAASPGRTVRAFFGMLPDPAQQGVGFGTEFRWDVPMREGYESTVVANRARRPGTDRFLGIDGPDVGAAIADFAPAATIVCGWQSRFLWQATSACRSRGFPLLVRGDSNALRRRPAWKRWLHRRHLARYAGFLAMGRSNADFYRELGIPDSRVHSAPHCIDPGPLLARLPRDDEARAALRARFGVPATSTCFVFVGKLEPKKRPRDLLRAFARVAARRTDVHLLIVGSGGLASSLRAEAAGTPASVSFAGFVNQSEIGAAYGAADALVLPSDFGETWGLVANEAMACGLPIVVSDRVGCGPDLARDGETGFTFPFGDVGALASRLDRFAADPEGRRRMGREARRVVEEEYSVAHAVAGTLAGVDAVLDRPPS